MALNISRGQERQDTTIEWALGGVLLLLSVISGIWPFYIGL